ncbi:MAG: PAS domain S-box protein [Chloroflexi bacterium]|nr:PAS domain S-box protein [Chloroflexota bacterium]
MRTPESFAAHWGGVVLTGLIAVSFVVLPLARQDAHLILLLLLPVATVATAHWGGFIPAVASAGIISSAFVYAAATGTLPRALSVAREDFIVASAVVIGIALVLGRFLEALEKRRRALERSVAAQNTQLASANEGLRSLEERHRLLLSAIPDMVFRIKADGTYLDFSPGQNTAPLVSPEVFLGKKVTDILPPQEAQQNMRLIAEALRTGQTQVSEYDLAMPDGVHSYEARITPAVGNEVVALVRNVTAFKQAQAALEEQQTSYRAVVDNSADGIVVSVGNRYVLANNAYLRIYGLGSLDELEGKTVGSMALPEYRPLMEARREARERGEAVPDPFVYKIRRPDGEVRTLELTGAAIVYEGEPATMVMVRDITEREQLETAVREQQALFQALLDNATDAISIGVADRRLYVNQAYLRLVGATDNSQALSAPYGSFMSDEDRPASMERLQRRLRGEEGSSVYEYRMRRLDGELRDVQIASSAITFNGRVTNLAIIRDITDLKGLEERLRQEGERYRNLVESIADVVYRVRGDLYSGRMEFVSSRVEALLGYKPEEFYRHAGLWRSLLHPEDVESAAIQTERILFGMAEGPRVYRMRHRSGEYRTFEDNMRLMRDEHGNVVGISGAARDITERIRLEESLREQQGMFQALLDNAGDAISVGLADRRLYVNQAYLRLVGARDLAQAVDAPYETFIAEEDREMVLERLQERLQGRAVPSFYEYRIQRLDGEVRHVQTSAVHITLNGQPANLAIIRDVTEQKRIEEELHQQEERYRVVVENASDGISIVVNERLTYVNETWLQIHGLREPAPVIGQPMVAFVTPEDRQDVLGLLAGMRAEGVSTERMQFRIRRADEAVRTVQSAISNLTFQGQLACVCIVRDITDRVHMEEELLQANSRLEEALRQVQENQAHMVRQERLSALGQLASGVVHDFNNALTPMVGFTSLFLLRPQLLDDKERAMGMIGACHEAAENATKIVARLRDFYRPRQQEEHLAPLDLNEVARKALELTRYVWQQQAAAEGRAIEVRTELGPLPSVAGNATELTEVLTNLILNAVDAIPQQGTITLRTLQEQQNVILHVTDTGIGMPEEVRSRCFEPFFTTKGEKGTGMGLAVVYGAVQRHGGTIDVASEMGKGTTFSIRLPVGP